MDRKARPPRPPRAGAKRPAPAIRYPEGEVARRIARARPALSQAHGRIADFVLAHPLRAATLPIDELAAAAGASVATANRFARALGYEGYPQFRSSLVLGFEAAFAPVERLRHQLERPASVAGIFAGCLEEAAQNIERTRAGIDEAACERAVRTILRAKRVHIAGFGASAWLGGLLARYLDRYRDNVQLVASPEGSSHAARAVARLGTEDLLIAIAFPRYFDDTILLAERAHAAGVPVLALTDGPASPLAPFATEALYAHAASRHFANSETAVLALIEALAGAVAHRAKDSVQAAAQLADAVLPWLHAGTPPRQRLRAPNPPRPRAAPDGARKARR